MHIHILGICGTLMGSIALLARAQGHRVTGTDQNVYPPMSDQLQAAGITLTSPYDESCVPPEADLVVIGNANLPRGNPAVETVLNRRQAYTSGAEFLGRYLLNDKWVIAISGTHGKTTTTSMVAWILEYAGLNPGYLVGGIPANFDHSARLGGNFFVIEADEYDTSYFDRRSKFLHYHPRTLVIGNLEYDHADIFADLAAIQQQFHLLLRTVPSEGLVIYPKAETHIHEVLDKGIWSQTLEIGPDTTLSAQKCVDAHFEVFWQKPSQTAPQSMGKVDWPLIGDHNINNALAAIAAASHIGVTPNIACEALCQFRGVKRRMEVIYQSPELKVYDDFAHHPSAIKTSLAGLRERYPQDAILAIIEPASHTMRKGTHAETLADTVSEADKVFWFEPENVAWDMRQSLTGSEQYFYTDIDALLADTTACAKSFQHIVIMSNGGFKGFHRLLTEQLQD